MFFHLTFPSSPPKTAIFSNSASEFCHFSKTDFFASSSFSSLSSSAISYLYDNSVNVVFAAEFWL